MFLMIVSNYETWPLLQVGNSAGLVRPGYTWLNAHTLIDVPAGTVDGTGTTWSALAQGMLCIHQEITDQTAWSEFSMNMDGNARRNQLLF